MARLLRPVMKIISVMPAATASSTAYWISGLSTMGSISFGCALVAGRKRLPRPATGKTAFLIWLMAGSVIVRFFLARIPLARPTAATVPLHRGWPRPVPAPWPACCRHRRRRRRSRFFSRPSRPPCRLPLRSVPPLLRGSCWAVYRSVQRFCRSIGFAARRWFRAAGPAARCAARPAPAAVRGGRAAPSIPPARRRRRRADEDVEGIALGDGGQRGELLQQLLAARAGQFRYAQFRQQLDRVELLAQARARRVFALRRHANLEQRVDGLLVFRLGEKVGDRNGDGAADVRQHAQQRGRRMAHQLEAAQPFGQRLGGRFTNMADAKAEQQPFKRRLFAGGDGFQQIVGPLGGDLALYVSLRHRAVALIGETLHL